MTSGTQNTSSRDADLASTVRDLRSPLSRIELAASRLIREDMPPRARALAATIREAVTELDGQLDVAARALGPSPSRDGRSALRAIHEWRARLAPVLEARGLRLETEASEAIDVDPVVMRRSLNALTRMAIENGRTGRLRVTVDETDGRLRLRAHWSGREGTAAPGPAQEAARRHAIAVGGQLDLHADGASLWLPSWQGAE